MLLRVDELKGQEEERDQVEDEADPLIGAAGNVCAILRFSESAEESPPGDEGRDNHYPAGEECEQRGQGAVANAVIAQFAVRLVVPIEVVDSERDQGEEEDGSGIPDLRLAGRPTDRNGLGHRRRTLAPLADAVDPRRGVRSGEGRKAPRSGSDCDPPDVVLVPISARPVSATPGVPCLTR